ncbi:MAG: type II toxin-antitoxin system RelE/ParE family toxin [Opitutales bacterium]
MANYRLTREADADLVEIARYTRETWGEAQRDKYINELFQLFEEIASTPCSADG